MTSSARDKRYGRRGGGWVDDSNAGHRLDGPACSICGQPMLLGQDDHHPSCATSTDSDTDTLF